MFIYLVSELTSIGNVYALITANGKHTTDVRTSTGEVSDWTYATKVTGRWWWWRLARPARSDADGKRCGRTRSPTNHTVPRCHRRLNGSAHRADGHATAKLS